MKFGIVSSRSGYRVGSGGGLGRGFVWLSLALSLAAGAAHGASTTQVGSSSVSGGSFGGTIVDCPLGTSARSGGTDVENVLTMRVTTNAPRFPEGSLFSQPDGPASAPSGWTGFAVNTTGSPLEMKVGAVCSPDFALSAVVGSVTVAVGSFGGSSVFCPKGMVAVGGGIDLENVLTMTVTGSAPVFPGPLYLGSAPNGENPAPIGWVAFARNDDTVPKDAKIAAICSAVAATTWVDSAEITSGSFGGANIPCPAGRETLGGGIDPDNALTMSVTSTAPLFGGGSIFLAQQPDGTAAAPVGWSGFARNDDNVSKFVKVAAICAPEPGAAASVAAALLGLGLLGGCRRRTRP